MGLLQKTSTPAAVGSASFAPLHLSDGEEIPVSIYQFAIYMDNPDSPVALFQNVTGMSVTRSVDELTVGGENNFGREFPGHVSYGHITLEVGLSSSDFFWKWMTAGDLDGYAVAKNFTMEQRRHQPDPDGAPAEEKIWEVVKRWNFENAFPVSWKISDLNLDNSSNIVIETLELSFDLFTLDT